MLESRADNYGLRYVQRWFQIGSISLSLAISVGCNAAVPEVGANLVNPSASDVSPSG